MKKLVLVCTGVLLSFLAQGQIITPVKWTTSSKKISDKLYEVRVQATISKGWYIYSRSTPDGGALPTTISFLNNPVYKTTGKVQEVGKMEVKFEDVFGSNVKYYRNKLEFVQVFQVKPGNKKTKLEGIVEFMACNGKQCLAPEEQEFSVLVN